MTMPSPAGSQPHVFLSYASADREQALAVADALEAAGVRVWIDRTGISGGESYAAAIGEAIRGCGALVLLCSAAAFASRNVRQEIALAWKHGRSILPLRLEPVEPPPELEYWLEAAQWVDALERSRTSWLTDVANGLRRLGVDVRPEPIGPETFARSRHQRSLPAPPNVLLGRERDVEAVTAMLATARLVTLTGPGGTGKTRLGIEVGKRLEARFAGNVAFVDLAPVREGSLVLPQIAQAIGVQDLGGQPVRESVRLRLAGEPWLLLVDNFEHVLDEAPLLAELLAESSELRMLVTSRALLRLQAEREFPVAPLPVAKAVALFVERAKAVKPGFAMAEEDESAIAEICRRLDGLPLAIELAAARVKLLSPRALLARLHQSLSMLTGGARDLPTRQQTLRNAISWSYDLLTSAEQTLFRQLAVFVGGWTFEAAEVVCVLPEDAPELFDILTSLIDKSLVTQADDRDGEPRFGMLETIREFGLEQLVASGEETAVRNRHAAWCLSFATREDWLAADPQLTRWFRLIERDIANLRAALAQLAADGQIEATLRLAADMFDYWWSIGPISEGRAWLEAELGKPGDVDPAIRLRALMALSWLLMGQNDAGRLSEVTSEALALARAVGNRVSEVICLTIFGHLAARKGTFGSAEQLASEALELAKELNRPEWIGFALNQLAFFVFDQADYARALAYSQEALEFVRGTGDPELIATALFNLGRANRYQRNHMQAMVQFRECIALWADFRRTWSIGVSFSELAHLFVGLGKAEQAATLLGAAERIRETTGITGWWLELAQSEPADGAARAVMGDRAFHEAFRAGRDMPWEQAVAEALRESDPSGTGHGR